MVSQFNAYLHFKDNAREAMEFYKEVFGGDVTFSTFGDNPMPQETTEADKIMHAELKTATGMTLFGADTPNAMQYSEGSRVSLSLNGTSEDDEQLSTWFASLAGEGTITAPLATAPWGDKFGMCTDKYGIEWMVNIAAKQA